MKGTTGIIVAAIVLALLGSIAFVAGTVDRRLARTQQDFASQNYARADETLDSLERSLEYGRWIPWIANGPLADVRTRRAAIRYWSGQYDRIVADQPDPVGTIESNNIELQLIIANAVYRRGIARAKNNQRATLDALQAATSAYLTVLRNATLSEAAAYNYEYVVRTREDIDKGRRAPELTDKAEDGPAGRKGGPPPQDPAKKDFKLLVPLEPGEMDKGLEPGKGGTIERKG
jgi:hypothetical protein